MSFKQYLLEFGDLQDRNFIIRPYDGGYESFFGDGFRVFFKHYKVSIQNEFGETIFTVPPKNSFDLNFTKNSKFDQTHAGTPFLIYSQVLAIIKKFITSHEPDALHISGWTPEMNLLYDKFYNRFLSNYYLRLDTSNYINKSYLQQLPEDIKKRLMYFSSNEQPLHSKYLQKIRLKKQTDREYDRKINNLQKFN